MAPRKIVFLVATLVATFGGPATAFAVTNPAHQGAVHSGRTHVREAAKPSKASAKTSKASAKTSKASAKTSKASVKRTRQPSAPARAAAVKRPPTRRITTPRHHVATSTTPTTTTPTTTTPTTTTPTTTPPTTPTTTPPTTPTTTTPTTTPPTTPTTTTPTTTPPTTPTTTTPTTTTPTTTTPTTTTVPDHVPTWAYDDGCNGGVGASATLVRQWLTYAESHCGPTATKAMSDCHSGATTYCSAIEYLDTNWIYGEGSAPGVSSVAQESWWLHQPGYSDAANRVSVASYDGGNLLNQSNTSVQDWFKSYVDSNFNEYDGLMMDDTSGSLSGLTYGSGYSSTNEISSDAALQSSHEQMAAALTHTSGAPFLQIDNALNPNDNLSTPFSMLNSTTGVEGVVAEGAPMSNGTLTDYYPSLLDEMAYVDNTAQDFIVLLSYDSSADPQSRLVQAATALLGYSGNHVVSWSDLETVNDDLAVWPEEGIVPTSPVQTMSTPSGTNCLAGQGVTCSSGGHNSLQVAPGVYRREFGDCYNQGASVGACAAIVNTTGSAVTVQGSWLTQSYGHQLTLSGGDVQSGGTVDPTGATFTAGSTQIPADGAALLTA
jgi:hypothetical protein